jgi:branched-chain amino acid transport system ATP-binding protein
MLSVTGLRTGYKRAEALHGVDISVGRGECVGILGVNGAGKSTLLASVLGIQEIWGGSILFDSQEIRSWAPHKRVRFGLGLVHESRELFGALSVADNLKAALFVSKNGSRGSAARIDTALKLFPALRSKMKQIAGTLSGGEQQMLAISRALIVEPRLLMLDEPSLGLAPMLVDSIYDTLGELRKSGLTMLIVEQHVPKLAAICDRLYVLDSGNVIFEGSRGDLERRLDIRDVYLGESEL